MTPNNYALLQDLLPVLDKHGIDIDGVHVVAPRRRMLARRGDPQRVEITIDGHVKGA